MEPLARYSVLFQQTDSVEIDTQVATDNCGDSLRNYDPLADLLNTICASHRSPLERTLSQLESGI